MKYINTKVLIIALLSNFIMTSAFSLTTKEVENILIEKLVEIGFKNPQEIVVENDLELRYKIGQSFMNLFEQEGEEIYSRQFYFTQNYNGLRIKFNCLSHISNDEIVSIQNCITSDSLGSASFR